jgi:hypothetical protein
MPKGRPVVGGSTAVRRRLRKHAAEQAEVHSPSASISVAVESVAENG